MHLLELFLEFEAKLSVRRMYGIQFAANFGDYLLLRENRRIGELADGQFPLEEFVLDLRDICL
jgi:hypothetical protein